MGQESYPGHRGFSLTLLGGPRLMGWATLVEECREARTWAPFCRALDVPGRPALSGCFSSDCEGPGLGHITVFFAEAPHHTPEDRHSLAYDSASLGGRIVYDPNPLVRYRVDVSDPASTTVGASLQQTLTFTPTPLAGQGADEPVAFRPLDLSHTAEVALSANAVGDIEQLAIAMSYPRLAEVAVSVLMRAALHRVHARARCSLLGGQVAP